MDLATPRGLVVLLVVGCPFLPWGSGRIHQLTLPRDFIPVKREYV
jgi:hypothetical protein